MSSYLLEEHQQAKQQKIINSPFFFSDIHPKFLMRYICDRFSLQSPGPFKDAYISFTGETRLLHLWCSVWLGNYMCIFLSPSSLYENGFNLDSRPQGHELRGQMKGAEGRRKQKRKVEESRGQNSIHLTFFPSLDKKLVKENTYFEKNTVGILSGFWVRVKSLKALKVTMWEGIAQIFYQKGEKKAAWHLGMIFLKYAVRKSWSPASNARGINRVLAPFVIEATAHSCLHKGHLTKIATNNGWHATGNCSRQLGCD